MKPYILILEDDPTLGRVVVKTTEQLKLAAFLDSDGNRYRDIIREQGLPKAILLDLHLPFAAGADLLQEFQSDEQLRNVPVLVLTADIVQARALQEQGQTVLLKPVSVTRLQEILSKFQDLP